MDRNQYLSGVMDFGPGVALRKESVDRNRGGDTHANRYYVSLSARRAWIEIVITAMTSQISVSLSARRAWIEIGLFGVDKVSY